MITEYHGLAHNIPIGVGFLYSRVERRIRQALGYRVFYIYMLWECSLYIGLHTHESIGSVLCQKRHSRVLRHQRLHGRPQSIYIAGMCGCVQCLVYVYGRFLLCLTQLHVPALWRHCSTDVRQLPLSLIALCSLLLHKTRHMYLSKHSDDSDNNSIIIITTSSTTTIIITIRRSPSSQAAIYDPAMGHAFLLFWH